MSQSSHHTASLSTAQAMDLLNEEWNREVLPRLPEGWESQARQLGAFQRQRQIQAAGDLLRGLLAYVLGPLSFRGVGEWAVLIGLGDLSGSAWRRRLLRASRWLEWLLGELLVGVVPLRRDAGQTGGRRVVLVDATCLKAPGGSGKDWKLHLAYDLTVGRLCGMRLLPGNEAEGVWNVEIRPGDIIVADQAYGYRESVGWLWEQDADGVLRIYPPSFPVEQETGERIDLVAWLTQPGSERRVLRCVCRTKRGQRVPVRLVAQRLSGQALVQAQQQARRRACKHGYPVSAQALAMAGWIVVVTTLPEAQWSTAEILELYRARWQIELLFKRMKSLAELAQLRCHQVESIEAAVRAWVVLWLLHEDLLGELRETFAQMSACEPWVFDERASSAWTLTQMSLGLLRQQVLGSWTAHRVIACRAALWRHVHPSPRRRRHQERWLRAWLSPPPGGPRLAPGARRYA